MKYFNGFVKDLKGRIITVTNYKAKSKNQMVSIKTMLEDFLEKYPKATLEADGTPIICPHNLGYEKFNECDTGNCVECWNRSV